MKKYILFFTGLFLISSHQVFGASDYTNDYTLIDCMNGENATGLPFDSTKPYKSLVYGIDKTLAYINSQINTNPASLTASGAVFSIKVSCSYNAVAENISSLNFYGETYKNHLMIEWIWSNGLVIDGMTFSIAKDSSNVTIKNAKFLSPAPANKWYFISHGPSFQFPYSKWLTIENAYLKIPIWTNIWASSLVNGFWSMRTHQLLIKNSSIDVEVGSTSVDFLPNALIRDSKIHFINTTALSDIMVSFKIDTINYPDYFLLLSNEIDLGWNNLSVSPNQEKQYYINNRFYNIKNVFLWNSTNRVTGILLNNLFESVGATDISYTKYFFNNVFSWQITDTFDVKNLRKNYTTENIWPKWIGWVFKNATAPQKLRIDYSSNSLYREITWKDIPVSWESAYFIFTR